MTARLRPNQAEDQLEHCIGSDQPNLAVYGLSSHANRNYHRDSQNSSEHSNHSTCPSAGLVDIPRTFRRDLSQLEAHSNSRIAASSTSDRRSKASSVRLPPSVLQCLGHSAKIARIKQGGQEKHDFGVEKRRLDGGNLLPLRGIARAGHGTGGSVIAWASWLLFWGPAPAAPRRCQFRVTLYLHKNWAQAALAHAQRPQRHSATAARRLRSSGDSQTRDGARLPS